MALNSLTDKMSEQLDYIVARRQQNWDYIKRAHQGTVHWSAGGTDGIWPCSGYAAWLQLLICCCCALAWARLCLQAERDQTVEGFHRGQLPA